MFSQSAKDANKFPEPPLTHSEAPTDERAKQRPAVEPPYRPYAENPALKEPPYEPYKGM